MELFLYLAVILFAAVMYYLGTKKPMVAYAALYFVAVLALCGMIWQGGIQVPGKGIDLSNPSNPQFESNSYTTANNGVVLVAAWLTFFYGTWGWYRVLLKSMTGGVNQNGTFK